MTKELLIKYLNNRCNEKEVEEVIEWMKQQSFSNESKFLGETDWHEYQGEDSIVTEDKLDSLLDKIHHKIHLETFIQTPAKKIKLVSWLTRAAAILLIPVLGFLFYTLSEKKSIITEFSAAAVDSIEVIAPVGSRTVVQLSDGSTVNLNYGSKIKYPQNFIGETREVNLVGEGYFEVAHNPEKPFIVKTGEINIKALGTTFNVEAYPGTNKIATTLVEGKVVLEKILKNGELNNIGAMVPGQYVSLNTNSGKMVSSQGNIEKYIAWIDGKIVFDNETITNIANKLSRMFNVEFEISDEIKDYTYTVTFVDEPLSQILELMTVATRVNYKTFPRTKNPDGTFSKQKIVLTKRK
jgi:hypothetical protein